MERPDDPLDEIRWGYGRQHGNDTDWSGSPRVYPLEDVTTMMEWSTCGYGGTKFCEADINMFT